MWRIALQAANTDVSLKAIHILNAAYLGRGEEFLTTCMKHLQAGNTHPWGSKYFEFGDPDPEFGPNLNPDPGLFNKFCETKFKKVFDENNFLKKTHFFKG